MTKTCENDLAAIERYIEDAAPGSTARRVPDDIPYDEELAVYSVEILERQYRVAFDLDYLRRYSGGLEAWLRRNRVAEQMYDTSANACLVVAAIIKQVRLETAN